jgi:DNA polymerase III epsilon subunit-like protein
MLMVLDVETTGLPLQRNAAYQHVHVWPRIVSISWAFYQSQGGLFAQRQSIVKPVGFAVPPDATRIHGISTAHAERHGRPILDVLGELNADLAIFRPALLVAHNIDYDRNVVLAEMVRAGVEPVLATLPTYCTMLESVDVCPIRGWGGSYKWPTLEELHQHLFREVAEDAHDAAADVRACARCYFELQRRLPGSHDSPEDPETEDSDDGEAAYAQGLIDRIIDWASYNDWFGTEFVHSVQSSLEEYGRLTERQLAGLENIISKLDIR